MVLGGARLSAVPFTPKKGAGFSLWGLGANPNINTVDGRRQQQASSGFASGLKHSRYASFHFIVRNKLAAVSLVHPFTYGSAKTRVSLQQPQSGILDEMCGIGASLIRDLRQLRFLFGREMDFHSESLAKIILVSEEYNARLHSDARSCLVSPCVAFFAQLIPFAAHQSFSLGWTIWNAKARE
jgi:hypothetical protein